MSTAFVLSGGASLGALQAGMLRALFERDITADLLVGTSSGALNAAFVASRPQTEAPARELARIWRGLQREDVFPVSMRALVGGLSRRRDHLVPDHGLRRLVARHIEYEDLADAATPPRRCTSWPTTCSPGARCGSPTGPRWTRSPLRSRSPASSRPWPSATGS